MSGLTFTTQQDQAGTVLFVAGEIDMHSSPDLRSEVDSLDVAHGTLVLDLSGVSFVDSSGLGALLGIRKQQDRGGGRLLLAEPSPAVARILEITKMDQVFGRVPPGER